MKSSEEIMEILEAFDLTGSLRGAAALAGCDHKTVAHYVALRDAGVAPDQRPQRPMLIDEFLDKVEEWMDRPEGKIRADVVHDKLVAMGFAGSERTTRRAVAAAHRRWWSGHRRVFRPSVRRRLTSGHRHVRDRRQMCGVLLNAYTWHNRKHAPRLRLA